MSDRMVMIPLPDSAPKDFEQRLNSQLAGEALFWQDIILHFDSSERTLEESVSVIDQFKNETLWSILDYRVPYPQRQRRRELVEKDPLSASEQAELHDLIAMYNRFVAVRSQALVSLKQRGYDIERYLKEQHR